MSYPGGKAGAGVYQAIINQMPPHELYIEPFAGGAAVLRAKRPAIASIAVEIDTDGYLALRAKVKSWWFPHQPNVTVIHGDGIQHLADRDHWTGRELVYCDPPYMMGTRREQRKRLYAHELDDAGHARLLAVLLRLPCMVMVSGYASAPYARALAAWRLVTFNATTRGGGVALEHLWCNFPEPAALHDYQYLGRDFRERERIKRKATRWARRLAALSALERKAVLSACLAGSADARGSSDVAMVDGEAALSADLAGSGEARSLTADGGDAGIAPRRI